MPFSVNVMPYSDGPTEGGLDSEVKDENALYRESQGKERYSSRQSKIYFHSTMGSLKFCHRPFLGNNKCEHLPGCRFACASSALIRPICALLHCCLHLILTDREIWQGKEKRVIPRSNRWCQRRQENCFLSRDDGAASPDATYISREIRKFLEGTVPPQWDIGQCSNEFEL